MLKEVVRFVSERVSVGTFRSSESSDTYDYSKQQTTVTTCFPASETALPAHAGRNRNSQPRPAKSPVSPEVGQALSASSSVSAESHVVADGELDRAVRGPIRSAQSYKMRRSPSRSTGNSNLNGSRSSLSSPLTTASGSESPSVASSTNTSRSRKTMHGNAWTGTSASSPSPSRARSTQLVSDCQGHTNSLSYSARSSHARALAATSCCSVPQAHPSSLQRPLQAQQFAAQSTSCIGHGNTQTLRQETEAGVLSSSDGAAWTWTRGGDGEERFIDGEHSATLLKRIRELAWGAHGDRERLSLCDVTLLVIDCEPPRRIAAHRVVLSAASEYFEALFSVEMREARTHEVRVAGVDGDTMQQLVDYVYSGTLELHEDSVERLLAAACRFRLAAAVAACSAFLARRLQPANCVGIWQFAERYACDSLKTTSLRYCYDHFCQLALLDEFPLLAADELLRLLRAEELNVPDEESVYCALVRWLQHDFDCRISHFAHLLRAVRLPLLSESFLLNEIDSNPALQSSSDVLQLVVAALKYHVAKKRDAERHAAQVTAVMTARSQMQAAVRVAEQPSASAPVYKSDITPTERHSRKGTSRVIDLRLHTPRRSMCGALWIIGGVDTSNKCSLLVERLNYYTNAYEPVTQLPTRRLQFGAALLDAPISVTGSTSERFLLIVGGRDGLKTLNTVDSFELSRNCWESMQPMATPRHGLGVAVLYNVLYAVGGHDGWSYLNTVERFELATRSWSYCAPLGVARSTCGVLACGQRLYAIGGRDGSACLRSVESFDPHSQKWTPCASMHLRRGGVACSELNGFVYAVGGHDAPTNNPNAGRLDSVERYDPRTDQWCMVAPLGGPRDALAVGTLGQNLFAIGGFDGQHYLNNAQVFDDEANEWRNAQPLRLGRAGAAAVYVAHRSISHLASTSPANLATPVTNCYTKSDSNSKRSSLTDADISAFANLPSSPVSNGLSSSPVSACSQQNPSTSPRH